MNYRMVLRALLDACRQHDHIIVVPLTSKLEFDRHQAEVRESLLKDVEAAYRLLERHSLPVERRDPRDLIQLPDLLGLLKGSGARVELVEPTLDDFKDAHRRACLHESPQPPDTKSDEMRDLVIWAIALRLGRTHGATMLLSRDNVHTHERGDAEASSANVVRVSSIEDALTYLEVETPAARAVLALLRPAWEELRTHGLPLPRDPRLKRVRDAVFMQGEQGLTSVSCWIELPAEPAGSLTAEVGFEVRPDGTQVILITNAMVDGQAVVASLEIAALGAQVQPFDGDYDERLNLLREVLGE